MKKQLIMQLHIHTSKRLGLERKLSSSEVMFFHFHNCRRPGGFASKMTTCISCETRVEQKGMSNWFHVHMSIELVVTACRRGFATQFYLGLS